MYLSLGTYITFLTRSKAACESENAVVKRDGRAVRTRIRRDRQALLMPSSQAQHLAREAGEGKGVLIEDSVDGSLFSLNCLDRR